MVQFLSIIFFSWISLIFVGFFKSSLFFVSLYDVPYEHHKNRIIFFAMGMICNVVNKRKGFGDVFFSSQFFLSTPGDQRDSTC